MGSTPASAARCTTGSESAVHHGATGQKSSTATSTPRVFTARRFPVAHGQRNPDCAAVDPLRVIAEVDGFFTRQQAMQAGYDAKAIARILKARQWVRVRPGAYTFPDLWEAADPVAQHLHRAHAIARKLGDRVALSHVSAALEHGLTVWNVDLSLVHVTRLDGGAGRIEAGVVHHEGLTPPEDLVERSGILVMKPARAALETGIMTTAEGALVVLDSLLHSKDSDRTRDELDATFDPMKRWPEARRLVIPVRMADGRAESAGETRGRHLCYTHHLPAPDLQYKVYDEHGTLVGISDYGWPEHRLLGEFDGKVKYGRLLKPGQEPGEVVFEEKKREDLLREITQFGMVRIIWSDYDRPTYTALRIWRMLRRAA